MCGRGIGNLLFPLVAAGILTNETAQPAAVVTAQSACPNCKAKISLAFDWCPQCGTGLRAHVCSYCGNSMGNINARFCPSCGAPATNQRSSI
jgi:predicted amidophosphoribosyltransferase